MQHLAMRVIRDEHAALAAMLRSLSMMIAQAKRDGVAPDFEVVRAMLFYLDEFPEKLHHAKESEVLFPRLRAHAPELAAVLDRIDADHARGERAIRELEHALLAYEVLGEPRREAFEQAVDAYLAFYLEHMAIEERDLLPAVEARFDEADWAAVDAAFGANRDPMLGHAPEEAYRPLFRRIVNLAPAPIGLGPAR